MANISIVRIGAVVKRHLYVAFRDMRVLTQDVYWPIMDLMLWGFMAEWMVSKYHLDSYYFYTMIASVGLWQVFLRSTLEVSISMLEEIWSRNLINFFSTPLLLSEWVIAVGMLAIVRTITTVFIAAFTIKLLFSWSLFEVGWILIPCSLNLLLFGLAIGFATSAILACWGKQAEALAWMMGWFCAPFSTIYCPFEALPLWMQKMSLALPMFYTYSALSKTIQGQSIAWGDLGIAFVLNVVYLVVSILLFIFLFEQSRNKGLSRLE